MGSLFKPKMPPLPPPPQPLPEPPKAEVSAEERERISPLGDQTEAETEKKTLLGA